METRYRQNALQRSIEVIKQNGISYFVSTLFNFLFKDFLTKVHTKRMAGKKFDIGGKKLPYFVHRHNQTWVNERIVEVPYFRNILIENKTKSARILEIGNVLGHYFDINHTVVDKYEQATGVINKDIVEFNPGEKFDFIFSISTFEHIGLDEEINDPPKVLRAIEYTKTLLNPGGSFYFSFAIGENRFLDKSVSENLAGMDSILVLKRTGQQSWEETIWDEIKHFELNKPFFHSNAVVFMKFTRHK